MKKQLLLILLFGAYFSSECNAQMYLTTTVHNGKTYTVYPARFPERTFTNIDLDIKKHDFFSKLPIISYNPFDLPNGDYIVYYEKSEHYNSKTGMMYQSHSDTTRIAAIFTIKDNNLNGECLIYNYYSINPVSKTYYKNGQCSGTWILYHNYYQKLHTTVSFDNNQLNGPAIEYYKNRIIIEGNFANNQLNGAYKKYIKGKLRENHIYKNDRLLSSNSLDKHGFVYNYWSKDSTHDYREKIYNTKTKKLTYLETSQNKDDSSFFVYSWFKNGKPRKEMHLSTDKSKYLSDMAIGNLPIYNLPRDAKILAYKSWHANGAIQMDFKLSKNDTAGKILVRDKYKNIQIISEWKLFDGADNQIERSEIEFDTKRSKVIPSSYQKSITIRKLYNYNSPSFTAKYRKNKMYYLNIDPMFLHLKYPDSIGMALNSYVKHKKNISMKYNLLHSTYILKENTNRKTKQKNDHYSYHLKIENGDTVSHLVQSYQPPKSKIRLDYSFDVPYKKGAYSNGSQYHNSLFYPTDTFNLRVFYDNEPFTGKVENSKKRLPKGQTLSGKITYIGKKKYDNYNLEISENFRSKRSRRARRPHGKRIKQNLEKNYNYFNCVNGRLNGKCLWEDIYCTYYNNTLNGKYTINNETGYYKNGVKDGLFIGKTDILNYSQNKINGLSFLLNSFDKQINIETYVKDDTLHGLFKRYGMPNQLIEQVEFKNGVPHGNYIRNIRSNPNYINVSFDHGYLVDTGFYYFKDAGLKVKVTYDRNDSIVYEYVKYQGTKLNRFSSHIPYKLIYNKLTFNFKSDEFVDFNPYLTGSYTYFYKNGVVAQIGKVKDNMRMGIWTMWDLNGGLFKEFDYTAGQYIQPVTKDTINYYGKIKMYYPNGKLLLEGLILEQEFAYKCDQEMEVPFEDIYYLSFFDKDGNQTLNENGGIVYEFHNNGTVRIKGTFLNGKRHGLWEFFDPEGRVEERGYYEDGYKEGIWLKGDLEGIPYADNMCSANFDDQKINLKSNIVLDKIEITQMIYRKGKRIDSVKLNLLPLF
jgi:antitoxin component YwqK of YwqJK toxin-antitoxin module